MRGASVKAENQRHMIKLKKSFHIFQFSVNLNIFFGFASQMEVYLFSRCFISSCWLIFLLLDRMTSIFCTAFAFILRKRFLLYISLYSIFSCIQADAMFKWLILVDVLFSVLNKALPTRKRTFAVYFIWRYHFLSGTC